MPLHHLIVHLLLAVPHALHMSSIGLNGRRLGLEGLLKIGHARRHSVRQHGPGTDGEDAESCERSDNCRFLTQISNPYSLGSQFDRACARSIVAPLGACQRDGVVLGLEVYVMCEARRGSTGYFGHHPTDCGAFLAGGRTTGHLLALSVTTKFLRTSLASLGADTAHDAVQGGTDDQVPSFLHQVLLLGIAEAQFHLHLW